ncbi:dystroglycan 1-like [Branchiostoma floridae x Branchiostoma belcheri]
MTATANQQPACKSHDSQHQPQECCHPQNLDSANQSNMAVPSLLVDVFCTYSSRRRGSISESRLTYTGTLLAVLVVCLLNFSVVGASKQHESNDVVTWLEMYPVSPVTDATVKSNVPVSVLWGVPDLTVVVGRLLQFTIPPDAFKGDIANYKVSAAGGGVLDSWVQWVASDRSLICTPTETDVGLHYITVTAIGKPNSTSELPSQASDVFSINVVPETAPESTAAPALASYLGNVENSVVCLPGEPFTMVTVIVDADPNKLYPKDKLKLLSGMKAHMKVPLDFLKLLPMGNKRILDASAFMAGPGNVKQSKTEGMLLSWTVGCGSDTSNLRGVNRVEKTAKNGEMARDLGYDVIGWHVTSPKPHVSKRMKRQLQLRPTPTPVPGRPLPPEEVPESSAIPPTRVIPTQASPIFTDMGRTATLEPTPAPSKVVPTDTRVSLTASPRATRTKPTMSASMMQTPTMLPPRPTRIDVVTSTVVPSRSELITPTPVFTVPVTPTQVTPPVTTPDRTPGRTPEKTTTPKTTRPDDTTPKKETTPQETTQEPATFPKTPQVPTEPNTPPELINHIDRVTVYQGEVLRFKIPRDTFYDVEDGNTRKLKLVFMNIDGLIMPKNSWIRFNDTSQELYGLPMGEHVGTGEYLMAALDSAGAVARDAFEIQVLPRTKQFNHKFSVRIDYDFDKFKYDVNKQLLLMEKLAKLYGESDTSSITVQEFKAGSVIYSWSNNTLPYYPCPSEEITQLRAKLMKDGEINPELVEALKPEFIVTRVSVAPAGPCDTGRGTDSPGGPIIDTASDRKTSEDDKWLHIVLPAVICAAILLLLGLIIFLLYRRRRKGKLSKEDKHTFVNKGIPIIFADELEDTKPTTSSTPVIMKDEKPPLPPPEYPKVPLPDMPPGVDPPHTPDDEFSTPPYQPPPPFSTPQGSRGTRPVIAPPYRSPPPYVPP